MKKFIRTIGLLTLSLGIFYHSYRLTARYLNRFRRNYITIENEHVNV